MYTLSSGHAPLLRSRSARRRRGPRDLRPRHHEGIEWQPFLTPTPRLAQSVKSENLHPVAASSRRFQLTIRSCPRIVCSEALRRGALHCLFFSYLNPGHVLGSRTQVVQVVRAPDPEVRTAADLTHRSVPQRTELLDERFQFRSCRLRHPWLRTTVSSPVPDPGLGCTICGTPLRSTSPKATGGRPFCEVLCDVGGHGTRPGVAARADGRDRPGAVHAERGCSAPTSHGRSSPGG